jgi:hypothetical protein
MGGQVIPVFMLGIVIGWIGGALLMTIFADSKAREKAQAQPEAQPSDEPCLSWRVVESNGIPAYVSIQMERGN